MFSKRMGRGNTAFALVKEKDKKTYQLSFFRKSGSDRQWKSVAGYRRDGSIKKGEEENPKHHYVQSGKIVPEIEAILESGETSDFQIRKYIPQDSALFGKKDKYKETYYEFINPQLRQEFENLLKLYRAYGEITRNITASLPPFVKPLVNILRKESGQQAVRDILEASKTSFEPDFSKPPVRVYKKGDITIEEYEVATPEGDSLIYAMACDSQGRVYIDNIYDKNSAITPYGTYENIINAGILVYKPEDYSEQVYNIPQELKTRVDEQDDRYIDIADMFSLIPVVKRYRDNLQSRGCLLDRSNLKKLDNLF